VPFWQFFRQGRDGRALLVQPSRIPHRISKILFALGADEFLAMLEGKIREAPFFKVQSGKITVCSVCKENQMRLQEDFDPTVTHFVLNFLCLSSQL